MTQPQLPRPLIVFVDDEAPVLHALRRQLDERGAEWDMRWCEDAAAALRVLDAERVDIVVSDMRMPRMDGAQLLEQVRQRQPACLRFMLSGYAERAGSLHALGVTHQYFAKPCDARRIGDSITRALRLRELLPTPELRELVVDALPPPAMPGAATRLAAALQAAQPELSEIAGIIESDVGLTAQLLKLVHSSDFSGASLPDGMLRAVHRIGLDAIESTAALAGRFDDAPDAAAADMQALEQLQSRSLRIGRLARRIAELEGLDARVPGLSAWGGTLSHVGGVVMWRHRPQLMRALAQPGCAGAERERELLGATLAEIGAALLAGWGLPDEVVDAVRGHGASLPADGAGADVGPQLIVHAARWLVDCGGEPGPDRDALLRAGAGARLAAWQQAQRELDAQAQPASA